MAVVLALAPLAVRGQAVESVEGGHPLGRCPPASGLDPRIDTGLGVTGRGLLTATDHVVSVRVPPLAVTAHGHAMFLVVLVTTRGRVDDYLPPLTVRGQRREDREPDMSSRRVWRR